MIKTFQDLRVYQRSKKNFASVVNVLRTAPREILFLKEQLLRSSNSIHANIAEGYGRTHKEFANYVRRSLGSNNETISHLEDIIITGYCDEACIRNLIEEYTILGKQLYTLASKWKENVDL